MNTVSSQIYMAVKTSERRRKSIVLLSNLVNPGMLPEVLPCAAFFAIYSKITDTATL